MKTIKLAVSVGLVVCSYSFCEAQSAVESFEPVQQKVQVTKELDQRIRNGATRVSGKEVKAMTLEQGKAYAAERFAERKTKGLKIKEVENSQQTTK